MPEQTPQIIGGDTTAPPWYILHWHFIRRWIAMGGGVGGLGYIAAKETGRSEGIGFLVGYVLGVSADILIEKKIYSEQGWV